MSCQAFLIAPEGEKLTQEFVFGPHQGPVECPERMWLIVGRGSEDAAEECSEVGVPPMAVVEVEKSGSGKKSGDAADAPG